MRPRARAKRGLTRTAAAAPQVGGQHWSRVSGPKTAGDASTSSRVTGSRNTAYGLPAACRRAFTATRAKRSGAAAVPLRVRLAGRTEVARGERCVGTGRTVGERPGEHLVEPGEGARPVGPLGHERPAAHLLEPEHEHDVGGAALDGLPGEPERRGARGAVVVHVDDRHAGHADPVEHVLAGGRVAVHVAHVRLLDVAVVDAGVRQGRADRPLAEHVVRLGPARRRERHHPDAEHGHLVTHGEPPPTRPPSCPW